ncbi:Fic family protein [Rhodococcus sp. IEGM 1379]|uniref:Fic family protein n=1 Tax=Rhodococcus sp. IEGM 1379 TaxID=3047086 RepID=UPI0024B71341|nr:Fic family protein [Rhodococcus sp. IEGM 1379]MDI9915496.1 Fic family protein [Rhodococcus sp. IEGM 1379]
MSANDPEPYRPIMPLAEWAEIQVDSSQLDIDYAYFNYHFDQLNSDQQVSIIRRVLRESAAESGALEDLYKLKTGESRTIATEAEGWESILGEDENTAERRSFEDLVKALNYATDWVDSNRPITLNFIRDLHAIACDSQKTFEVTRSVGGKNQRGTKALRHGEFKTDTNFVQTRSGRIHPYCPPDSVQAEMDKFCEQLRSPIYEHIPPITRSAYVHYCISQIHPFEDGNGRVSRIVASMILMQTYRVPLVVYSDRKQTYLQALEAVENKDYGQLIQNITDRIAATLAELAQSIESNRGPTSENHLSKLMQLVDDHAGVEFANVKEIIGRVMSEFVSEVDQKIQSLTDNSNGALIFDKTEYTSYHLNETYDMSSATNGEYVTEDGTKLPYDRLPYSFSQPVARGIYIRKDEKQTDISASVNLAIGTARNGADRFPFALIATPTTHTDQRSRIGYIRLRMEDCFPNTGTNTTTRMQTLADNICKSLLRKIESSAEKRLHQSGSLLGSPDEG